MQTLADVDEVVYNFRMQDSRTDNTPAPSPRERILLTAHNLFYRNGIRATGIDRVIAEAHVTKVTFYRHFPSKNDLILEYLAYRHERWIRWFEDALSRHGNNRSALVPALREWFNTEDFRGCAFINSLGELGELPDIASITRRHKQAMTIVIERLLAPTRQRKQLAEAIALVVDGAIVRAQYDPTPDNTLKAMGHALKALAAKQPR